MLEAAIASYLKETFSFSLMTDKEIEQLAWSVRAKFQTPEKEIVKTLDDFSEVRRCASRLYCLQLLRQGASGYEKFIEAQQNLENKTPLSREQYLDLSLNFVSLSPLAIEALRVSTIVSSVTLSKEAKDNADRVLGAGKYTQDSVEFLADTFENIEHAQAIYPLVKALFEQHPDGKERETLTKLLQAAFSHRQHYRHMLYTEGNDNMFNALLASVKSGQQDKEGLEFWACHWRINIAGFRGHLDPKGSLYLTSETFKGMRALEESLAKVLTSNCLTSKEILNEYLDKRAGFLKLERFQLEENQRRLLAHVAAMLRLYTPKEGEILAASISFIPKAILSRLSGVYFDCHDKTEPTPTYAPALFENILDYCKKEYQGENSKNHFIRGLSIFNAIVIGIPFYLRSLEEYRAKRISNSIPTQTPLCFKDAAYAKKIVELCGVLPLNKEFDILSFIVPQIDDKGIVSFNKLSPSLQSEEDLTTAAVKISSPTQLRSYQCETTTPESAASEAKPPFTASAGPRM